MDFDAPGVLLVRPADPRPELGAARHAARVVGSLRAVFPNGFSLTTTITLAALTNGHVVRFIPIDYHPRIGRSKIHPLRDPLEFVQLILRTVLYFDPLRVFVPVSLALLAASVLVGGISWALATFWGKGRFLDSTTIILFVSALQMLAIGVLADLITKRIK